MEFIFTADQDNWLNDLEQTQAEQGTGALHSLSGWCCLGRACVLAGLIPTIRGQSTVVTFDGCSTELPPSLTRKLHLRSNIGGIEGAENYPELMDATSLSSLNDMLGWTFKQIARWIRKNPTAVFTRGYQES